MNFSTIANQSINRKTMIQEWPSSLKLFIQEIFKILYLWIFSWKGPQAESYPREMKLAGPSSQPTDNERERKNKKIADLFSSKFLPARKFLDLLEGRFYQWVISEILQKTRIFS